MSPLPVEPSWNEAEAPAPTDDVGPLEHAAGAGYAGLRGLSGGLSDQAISEASYILGGERARGEVMHDLSGLRAATPIASAAGELVGTGVGLALTGGAGAAGEAVAGGAAKVLGESALARIATKGLAGAVTGGIENVAIGAGHQISEAALGDHELNGERVGAELVKDALFGAGVGGILGTVGGGVSELIGGLGKGAAKAAEGSPYRALSKIDDVSAADIERIAKRQFGEAAPGIGDRVREWYVKQASALSGKEAGAIDRFTALTPEGKAARRMVYDADATMDAAARDARKHLDAVIQHSEAVESEFRGGMKRAFVERSIGGDKAQHVAFAEARADELLTRVQGMLDSGKPLSGQHIKTLEALSTEAYAIKSAIAKDGANASAEAFIGLDNLKRLMQDDWKTFGRQLQAGAVAGVEGRAGREAVEFYRGFAETLRSDLQNAELWGGKLAGTQEALNAPWAQSIQAGKDLLGHVTEFHGTNPLTLQKNRVASPSKIDNYLKNLTNTDKDLVHQDMAKWLQGKEKFAKVAKEALELDPAMASRADAVVKAAADMRATLEKTGKDVVTINQLKALTSSGGDGLSALLGTVGFAGAGPIGGAVGAALGTMSNPGQTIKQLAAIERISDKYGGKVTSAAKSFFGGKPPAARAMPMPRAEVSRIATAAAKSSPVAIAARVQRSVPPDLVSAAPGHAAAITGALTRAAAHLAEHAPKIPPPNGLELQSRREAEPSPQQLTRFGRRVEVVQNPTVVLDRMRTGDLTREHVDTLRTVYPRMYESVKTALVEEAMARKKPLTIQEQAALSCLFDEPLHAMFLPKSIAAFQASAQRADAEQQAPGPVARSSRKVEVDASRLTTGTQKETGA
jgi:hypothetical protein